MEGSTRYKPPINFNKNDRLVWKSQLVWKCQLVWKSDRIGYCAIVNHKDQSLRILLGKNSKAKYNWVSI